MRLGIFGGTFDPPHIAHLILAQEAQLQLKLDRVLWVLTPAPPHKSGQRITPLEDRLALLQAALQDTPAFELSRVDIDRLPPHFSADTLRLLRQRYPADRLIYLMGTDSLFDLHNWHQPDQFVRSCDEIGIMPRPGWAIDDTIMKEIDNSFPGLGARLRLLKAAPMDIASSVIRQRIRSGQPYRYFLTDAVYHLIQARGLYLQR